MTLEHTTARKTANPGYSIFEAYQKSTLIRYSVIIVNYNGRDYISECLDSLLNSVPAETEIIVVDNDSKDTSADFIQEQYPGVVLLRNPLNGGFGQGNNLGVEHAHGEYLVFLNPDTRVTPGWLENMIEVLDSAPNVGMVTPKILLMNEPKLINACGNDVHFTGLTLCRGARATADSYDQLAIVSAVSGAAFVMRRSVFDEIGGFDPLLFMYMDDTDLSLRVRQAGYECIYAPNSVVYHDYSLSFGPRKTYFQERNRYIMLLKSWRWRTLALMVLPLLLSELVTWGFVLTKERRNPINKLRAYWDILKVWPEIMTQRCEVQTRRKVTDRKLLTELTYRMEFEQTGNDTISRLAHATFDPMFYAAYRLLMLVVRW
jgi:GT2 family glycosyltransferase